MFSLGVLQYFHFWLDTTCRYLSNKIGFILFGVRMLELVQFWSELFPALSLEPGDSGVSPADTPVRLHRTLRRVNVGDSGLVQSAASCRV